MCCCCIGLAKTYNFVSEGGPASKTLEHFFFEFTLNYMIFMVFCLFRDTVSNASILPSESKNILNFNNFSSIRPILVLKESLDRARQHVKLFLLW